MTWPSLLMTPRTITAAGFFVLKTMGPQKPPYRSTCHSACSSFVQSIVCGHVLGGCGGVQVSEGIQVPCGDCGGSWRRTH
ncbi:Hypothetical protein FKW44_006365 [Caligus rogercresseyi]|uniref:Secreted protein n=1 Tax=Caligus rogercresseyi TaxID=217165 RepID=A0A7T8KD81_CALRO|nr:Hypothetical protein FKW44_006365 [Caligus rogercresseyi]